MFDLVYTDFLNFKVHCNFNFRAKPDEPTLLEDPQLKKIADRLHKTVAHVVLRYQIQRGVVVIPKSVTPSRIESNMKVSKICFFFPFHTMK